VVYVTVKECRAQPKENAELEGIEVRGNEIAVDLARDDSVLKFVVPQPALGASKQEIRRRIRRWLVNPWATNVIYIWSTHS